MIFVDFSHISNRAVTGIERLSKDLFSRETLLPLNPIYVEGGSTKRMIREQWLGLPLRLLRHRSASVLCPGFPPSVLLSIFFGKRVWVYIFDLFLLTRKQDLNWKAKLYMAPSLHFALKFCNKFLVLSETVKAELETRCRPGADILVYRSPAHNVFNLDRVERSAPRDGRPIRLLSIGTVEPRKNYLAAAAIRHALQIRMKRQVELHIVGRAGWGGDFDILKADAGITLHGFLQDQEMRSLVDSCDAYLYTTRAEGLGLPVLEVQHSGIPVIANDLPILRESLADSAIFIDAENTDEASEEINKLFLNGDIFREMSIKSAENIRRWNNQAVVDREKMIKKIYQWARAEI